MKILIVDDEQPARERLARLVPEDDYTICGEASNGVEAISMIQTANPDIVLMDILMPRMDGLETALHLAKLDAPPAVIFTTAYDEHALAAFEAHAVAYLLKPVRKQHLDGALYSAKALNRAQLTGLAARDDASNMPRSHICAKLGNRLELIPLDEIYFFQAESKYVTVRHRRGEAVIEETLKSLEHDLAGTFIRIHRSALVSATHIASLQKNPTGYRVKFNDIDDSLEVSRRHVPALRRFLRAR